jgi:hypothetical protein
MREMKVGLKRLMVAVLFVGFTTHSSVQAQSAKELMLVERTEKKYRESALAWTVSGAAITAVAGISAIAVLGSSRDACKGVEGECWDGLGAALLGSYLLLGVAPVGAVVMGHGLHRYRQANRFSVTGETSNPSYYRALLEQEAQRAKKLRYLWGGASTAVGLGGISFFALSVGGGSGAALGTLLFAPFLGLGVWALSSPSLAEDALMELNRDTKKTVTYRLDVSPQPDGMYAGIRLNF